MLSAFLFFCSWNSFTFAVCLFSWLCFDLMYFCSVLYAVRVLTAKPKFHFEVLSRMTYHGRRERTARCENEIGPAQALERTCWWLWTQISRNAVHNLHCTKIRMQNVYIEEMNRLTVHEHERKDESEDENQ